MSLVELFKVHTVKYSCFLQYIIFKVNHAKNGGEFKIGPYYVDGVCHETQQVFEFNGCMWHGCDLCYSPTSFNPITQCTFASLKIRQEHKVNYIVKNTKYKVKQIWEHQWESLKRVNKDLQEWLSKQSSVSPIESRDCLFGGRTNGNVLYYFAKAHEQIKYYDITSLYPYVQKYMRYPVGHPKIITENFKDITCYFGIAKLTILPPRGLLFPVLPAKINNKLVFTLCYACACEQNKGECAHDETQRALTMTWCTPEINKALEKGYRVLQIHEVYHYEENEQYNPETKQGGLFTKYVNAALKTKQEASGYPANVQTEEDKDRYIQDYYNHEGIWLDKSKIAKNPGMRTLAKLQLNTLWGYFGMNCNKTQHEFVRDVNRWNELLHNDRFIIHSEYFEPESPYIQVAYSEAEQVHVGNNKTNVILAGFVTSWARLELYKALDMLGERVLYFDTDSVYFVSRPGEPDLPLGDYLGMFTDELDKSDGNFIQEFCTTGPKSVGWRTDTGVTHCTLKGITYNYLVSCMLDFEKIKEIVYENDKDVTVPQLKFCRKKNTYEVFTQVQDKNYRFTYDKRIVMPDFTTRPYGFFYK
jgi:hypothetical protein